MEGHLREDHVGEQVLEERRAGIELALNVETDPDKVEGLLRERQGVEVRLTAIAIAAQNRQRQAEADRAAEDRARRSSTLRARRAALAADLEGLEQKHKAFVAAATRENPALAGLIWDTAQSREYTDQRAALVQALGEVEAELATLEGETERAPLPA